MGEGDLLDLPCKRRAAQRYDLIIVVIVKVQLTATQHQACQITCGPVTEAALCQPQGVPLEVTCRGEVAYSSEDGNVAPAREVILL